MRRLVRACAAPSGGDAPDPFEALSGRVRGVGQARRRRGRRPAAGVEPEESQVVLVLAVIVGVHKHLLDGKGPPPSQPRQRHGKSGLVFEVANQVAAAERR